MIRFAACHQAACPLSPSSARSAWVSGCAIATKPRSDPGPCFPFCSRISIAFAIASRKLTLIYSRKLDFEDAGARQGIILVWKSGLPIMTFLSGDGESMRLGP